MPKKTEIAPGYSLLDDQLVETLELSDDDRGLIPDRLAQLTESLLEIHKTNGDLAWVIDMARDMEHGE